MQLLNFSFLLIPTPMFQNINTQIQSTSGPFLSGKIKQAILEHLCHKKDTNYHDNSAQRLQTVAPIEDYTARLLVQLLSCRKWFSAAVHKCQWLTVQLDVQRAWWGGVGAVITSGVLWHLSQGGRTPNVAGGGVAGDWVRTSIEGKHENKKISQPAVELEHAELLQMTSRK